jgi:hypothetical protein
MTARLPSENDPHLDRAEVAADALRRAAAMIREDPERRGSTLYFGSAGQLVMTGDLHGNLRNFEKLRRFCQLQHSPGRRVILHELMHDEPLSGPVDLSIDLVVQAAAWKCEFPDNVYFLQSNHELSQLRRHEISKGGRSVIHDFERGVQQRYGREAERVLAAVDDYLSSLPLAARLANGVFLSHSLPDLLSIGAFDRSVLEREPSQRDLEPGGSAYALVWGRYHSPQLLDLLAQLLEADIFITGHMPQEMGYAQVGRMVILASEHGHGTFLPIDLSRRYTVEELVRGIRKFVEIE